MPEFLLVDIHMLRFLWLLWISIYILLPDIYQKFPQSSGLCYHARPLDIPRWGATNIMTICAPCQTIIAGLSVIRELLNSRSILALTFYEILLSELTIMILCREQHMDSPHLVIAVIHGRDSHSSSKLAFGTRDLYKGLRYYANYVGPAIRKLWGLMVSSIKQGFVFKT